LDVPLQARLSALSLAGVVKFAFALTLTLFFQKCPLHPLGGEGRVRGEKKLL